MAMAMAATGGGGGGNDSPMFYDDYGSMGGYVLPPRRPHKYEYQNQIASHGQ